VREPLKEVRPFPAVFGPRYVARIGATHEKKYASLRAAAEQVREDIRSIKSEHGLDRVVMVNCASTEAYAQP
jgi:myo-inositol-1-phosphate synthase